MKKFILLTLYLLFFFLLFSFAGRAQKRDSAQRYVDGTLSTIQPAILTGL
ncbi:MAG TPA: hypothetical protein VEY10_05730 [Flavisolibacter sp.]|nr:hypothetical protein [Flavisolibacter sp.]